MAAPKHTPPASRPQKSIWTLLGPYKLQIGILMALSLGASALNLFVPKLIAKNIDAFSAGTFELGHVVPEFFTVAVIILIATYAQSVVQTYASERVARDLRQKLIDTIARQSYAFMQKTTAATLLTNLTSDVDSIKLFVAQALVAMATSVFIIVGASILLLRIDWQLGLAVMTIIPLIGGLFFFVLQKVRAKFLAAQKVLDSLNKVINESIVGSTLVRVLHSQDSEDKKFVVANTDARNLGLEILSLFASLIPVVTFFGNFASLIILVLGGHFVIIGRMSLGDFTAFFSYLTILIFPIFILGFMSNVLARATASYQRLSSILYAPDPEANGTLTDTLKGALDAKHVSLSYEKKTILKDVSFHIKARSRVAIIGPTGEGKTQLLYLLTGLTVPTSGTISYDDHTIAEYDQVALHEQVGFVFQDSNLFNLTIRENIAFNTSVTDDQLAKAIDTAELRSFIDKLPKGLETIVSERGTSLSGGQKQRIMLARALALNPKVLLLDDFTARVDSLTESRIVKNLQENYPDLTLISVSQKISSVKEFDNILLLIDGEVLASGTHEHLVHTSPEYVQIYESQKSTNQYEVHTE